MAMLQNLIPRIAIDGDSCDPFHFGFSLNFDLSLCAYANRGHVKPRVCDGFYGSENICPAKYLATLRHE
jgi:hypothetical protein